MAEEAGKLLPIKETQIGFWVLNIPHTAKPDYDFERACIGMDRTDIETEILINWNASSGMRIYEGFDPDVHVSKTELPYYPTLPLCVGWDFGLSPAALIGQLNPLGQFQIFPSLYPEEREYEGIYSFGEKVADHLLKNYCMPHGRTLKQLTTYHVGDPAGRAMTRHTAGGRTSRELFSCFQILNTGLTLSLGEDEEGLPVREHLPGWGWLLYGGDISHDKRQEAVRARLRWMIRPKVPALIVDPREEFIQSAFLGGYRRKVFSDGTYDRNPLKSHESHCLQEGTMVTTRGGEKAIETVSPADEVLTRDGWRRVRAAWHVGNREVCELSFSNGTLLVCTPEHLIWADQQWTQASSLGYNEVCLERKSSTTETSTTGIPTPRTTRTAAISGAEPAIPTGGSTWWSGRKRTALFPRAWRFITSTVTRLIMPWRICSVLRCRNIDASMQSAVPTRHRLGWLTWSAFAGPVPPGTRPMRAALGTESTRGRFGMALRRPILSASGAERLIRAATSGGETVSALPTAALNSARPAALMTKTALACTAESSSEWTAIPNPGTAAVLVLGVRRLPGKVPVYDLQIEAVPEFYANGILVHNCMNALEYLLSRLKVTPARPEEEMDEDRPRREPFRSQSSSYHRG